MLDLRGYFKNQGYVLAPLCLFLLSSANFDIGILIYYDILFNYPLSDQVV